MFTERVGRYTIAPPRAAGPTERVGWPVSAPYTVQKQP